MSLPDFILIGAMKSGTTTLAKQLELQSGVFITQPKEPNYFSDDDVFAQGPDWYSALFDAAAPGDLKGEASTHYTKMPTYPQTLARMQAALPHDLKLIYMIRNPIDRAISHYIHEWSEGRLGKNATAAFENTTDMIAYGQYAMQIEPFIEAYGRESVFLTSLEQIKLDPDEEFKKICAFLGAPAGSAWQHDLPPQNVSAERSKPLPFQKLLVDNPVSEALRRSLVPKSLRTWVRQKRSMDSRPHIPETLIKRMEHVFIEDRARLADLFPDHPALTQCYGFAPDP